MFYLTMNIYRIPLRGCFSLWLFESVQNKIPFPMVVSYFYDLTFHKNENSYTYRN